MDLPVSLFTWVAAVLPIVALLALLIKWRWGVAQAAPVGLGIALFTGLTVFGGSLPLLSGELAKGIWGGIAVTFVVVPAILIFEVTNEAGAFEPFRRGMKQFSPNELLQILTVGWVFSSFLQGVTGFGVPVAIVAPLLTGLGVRPFWAVAVPVVGHAWGSTFGTLAVAWEALVLQTGIDGATVLATAFWAGLFIWIMNLAAGLCICWFYAKVEGLKQGLPAVLAISTLHGGGQMLIAQYNPVLCNFLVASAALLLVYGLRPLYRKPYRYEQSPLMDRDIAASDDDSLLPLTLHQAFLPYYALTVITLFVLLVPPVKKMLGFLVVGLPFPETITAHGFVNPAVALYAPITVFTHAGAFLTLSSLVGYLFFKNKKVTRPDSAARILQRTMKKAAPATIAVILLIAMSRVMGGTGQVLVLAQGTAAVTGKYYALFAPFIGVLGAFMTSSNMASNILFSSFQHTMAELLHLSPAVILGAQTGGAAIGNVLCPGNVLLGATTVGILGREGELLKMLMPLGLAVAALCGAIALIVT